MASGRESFEASNTLRETLVRGRPEYETLIRRTSWGESPVYFVGSGASYAVGVAGAYALESLAGFPAVARSSQDFAAYAITAVPRRAVVLAVSRAGESRATLEAARAARSHGATLLAITGAPESTLAKTADGVVLVRGSAVGSSAVSATIDLLSRHAAVGFLSLVAARTLKRPRLQLEAMEHDFEKLPEQVEWLLSQLDEAARRFASELNHAREIRVIAAGFSRPVAMLWAHQLSRTSRKRAVIFDPGDEGPPSAETGATYVFLSSSRSRLKTYMHEWLSAAKKAAAKVLALTDTNDRELREGASLAVLLPATSELVGSTLALAMLLRIAALLSSQRSVPQSSFLSSQ